jgi:hypothetical protein
MKIIEKFKNMPRDTLNIILNYNGTIKYRKGIYSNIIPKNDYRYKLVERVVNKKIKILNSTIKDGIKTTSFEYLKMVHRSYYYHAFFFE